MNTATKLLVAMRRNPLDWQHDKSSHCVFVRGDGRTLFVPAHRPIKPIYVRKFIELIQGTVT